MPMLARQRPWRPGMQGGSAGFSKNAVILSDASTAITPKLLASATETSMQPTVTSAFCSQCCCSIGS